VIPHVFDHVAIRASDLDASIGFYELVLRTIGFERGESSGPMGQWDDYEFIVATASPANPVTRGLHIGFYAPSREHVDAFWRAGTEAGYRDDGAPGPRPEYGSTYYGGFLLDPDGNSAEAVHHDGVREHIIDHLWIRVADVPAAQRFYETIAPHAGFRRVRVHDDRTQFGGESGSFSVVDGPPTAHLHLAFPATANDAVDAFHSAATAAGYPDNGAPGERDYHPGYYAAFVLDPDGNNVEVVNHNRG
jgi:catechol 2,3-dioxygenase-like lactoylglutathione lyase family enzyme